MTPPADLPLRCQGAPRDLGLDQGRALACLVRRAVRRERGGLLERWTRRDRGLLRRVVRDVRRHFPHMAERTAGLARGAGVSEQDLAALLAREVHPGSVGRLLAASEGRAGHAGDGPVVALGLPPAVAGPCVERRSAPDGDHRSLDLALPWLVPALAGVNEHGLAVAASVAPATPASLRTCAAPALLLVQDCLQRFDAVEKAVEWCLRRPAGGRATILLADAPGAVVAVHVDGDGRRVDRGRDGLVLGSVRPAARAALEKACAPHARLDRVALAGVAGERPGPGAGGRLVPAGRVVLLEPASRHIGVAEGRTPTWSAA